MSFRQLFAACASGSHGAAAGLCGRLRDTVLHNNDKQEDAASTHSAVWKDLTLSILEPAIPKEIRVTLSSPHDDAQLQDDEEENDSLVGLEILEDNNNNNNDREAAPTDAMMWHYTLTTECSWTYSTTSSRDLQDCNKFDDGSSYSSSGGKPPRAPQKNHTNNKPTHKKTVSHGTLATVSTGKSSARSSRSNSWGSF